MKTEYKIWEVAIILLIIMIIGIGAGYSLKQNVIKYESITDQITDSNDLIFYWVCMDGCFEMIRTIYFDNGDMSGQNLINNQTLKSYHSSCSQNCYDLIVVNNGDYIKYEQNKQYRGKIIQYI